MPIFNINPNTIRVKTSAQWAVDATVYGERTLLITRDVVYTGTTVRKFKISDGILAWAALDYFPDVNSAISALSMVYQPLSSILTSLTALTNKSVPFYNGTAFTEDNTNFNWDNTTKTLTAKIFKIISSGGDIEIGQQGHLNETQSGLATILGNGVKASTTANEVIKTKNDDAYWVKIRYDKGISFHGPLTGAIGTTSADDGLEIIRLDPTGKAIFNNETANRLAIYDSSKKLISANTTTYPDLTEFSYVKGVTSAIQTQLNNKQAINSVLTDLIALNATAFGSVAGTFTQGNDTRLGHNLRFMHTLFNPADATTYRVGTMGALAPATSVNTRFMVRAESTGTLNKLWLTGNYSNGSNEATTIKVINNNTAQSVTLTSSFDFSTINSLPALYTSIGLTITEGDLLYIEYGPTTWVTTNPTSVQLYWLGRIE